MYLKHSIGFLIASFVQAAIIMLTETLGISYLGAKFTAIQLILHVLAGQVAGYALLFILRRTEDIIHVNTVIVGSIFGLIVWAVILTINSMRGAVRAPWNQGISTVLSSMFAFIIYGIISTYTIKKYGYKKAEA